MTTERAERISGELREKQSTMNNIPEEENPDWNRFWSYNPSPNDPHEFGEFMRIGTIINGEKNRRNRIAERR